MVLGINIIKKLPIKNANANIRQKWSILLKNGWTFLVNLVTSNEYSAK